MIDFFGKSSAKQPSSSSSLPRTSSNKNGTTTTSSKQLKSSVTRPAASSSSVVVTTVRKKPIATPKATISNSTVTARNGLPEEARRRIEAQRKADAQAAAAAAARSRSSSTSASSSAATKRKRTAPRPSTSQHNSQNGSRNRTAAQEESSSSESDADPSDVFGTKHRRANVARTSHDSGGKIAAGYREKGREGVLPFYDVPREDLVDTRSCGGQEGEERPIQSTQVVKQGKLYHQYFNDLSVEQATATLKYPATGASEEFQLLVSRDPDEYDPISELLRTVYSICAHYMTEEERASHQIGTLDMLEVASLAGNLPSSQQKRARTATGTASPAVPSSPVTFRSSPLPSLIAHSTPLAVASLLREHGSTTPASTERSTPDISTSLSPKGIIAASSAADTSISSNTSSASASGTAAHPTTSLPTDDPEDCILRQLTKARNRRSGPLFLHAVSRFNAVVDSLRMSGALLANLRSMRSTGIPTGLWRMIQEQCYNRAVGPSVEELSGYRAFSDNVYGELLPGFVSELAQLTSLGPQSLFIDLGSGVGNVLIQLALQTGARVCGVEQLGAPARLADLQLREARRRWRLWGLRGGEMECWQGDFGEDEKTRQRLREADVVLVNNYAFTSRTNDNLSLLFLDLPESARIVSLKPFVPHDFRLTERTLNSPSAILRVEQRRYGRGCVSWADGGGVYYLHTIDRSMVRDFVERQSAAR